MKNNKLKKLENLKLRTSTFGLKNKLGIIAIVCLLIFAGYSGVNATIKLGNDGTTDWSMVDTDKVRTSNGKSFPATGAGILNAVWSFNNTDGGTIIIPSGDIPCSNTILIERTAGNRPYICIRGVGTESTELVFDMIDGSNCIEFAGISNTERNWFGQISDLTIRGDSGAVTGDGIHIGYSNHVNIKNVFIENIDGDGIHIGESAHSVSDDYASFVTAEQIGIYLIGGKGIYIGQAGGGTFIQTSITSVSTGIGIFFDGGHDWAFYRTFLSNNSVIFDQSNTTVDRIHISDFHQEQTFKRDSAFLFKGVNVSNRIRNVVIEGGNVGRDDVDGVTFDCNYIKNIQIRNCMFTQGDGTGIGINFTDTITIYSVGEVIVYDNHWGSSPNFNVSINLNKSAILCRDSQLLEKYPVVDSNLGYGLLFDSVQDAVDFLDSSSSDVGTVFIPPVTFSETITIDVGFSGCTIQGQGINSIIDGGITGHAISSHAPNITICDIGLKTTPGGGNSYKPLNSISSGSKNWLVKNVWILNSDDSGVNIQGKNHLFDNVYFNSSGIDSASDLVITSAENITVRNCVLSGYWGSGNVNSHFVNNIGYVTENGGANTSTVDGGTITHGLASTPTYVLVTGSVAGEMLSVTALGVTTFTVAIKDHAGNAGTSQTVYWRAYYIP